MTSPAITAETVELLQTMIRNGCVNDGTPSSGFEHRNADTLHAFLGDAGFDVARFEPNRGPGLARRTHGGPRTGAPSLCLMGHTDVVPVNPEGWTRAHSAASSSTARPGPRCGDAAHRHAEPHRVDGRGVPAARHARASDPEAISIYFAVADEESGSAHGARWMADHEADAIRADYVLTENGGLHSGPAEAPYVGVNVGEKGVAWRRLRVRGTPGHGRRPIEATTRS